VTCCGFLKVFEGFEALGQTEHIKEFQKRSSAAFGLGYSINIGFTMNFPWVETQSLFHFLFTGFLVSTRPDLFKDLDPDHGS